MKESIDSLFCNNPDLSHRIYTYCKADPEFMEAEVEYDALLQSLEQTLGYARMQEIEDCFLRYSARLVQAYYLFGLGLRQEVLRRGRTLAGPSRSFCHSGAHPHPPPSGAPVPIPSVAARHLPLIRGVGPLGGGRLAGG